MKYYEVPDDPTIDTYGQDSGWCHVCGHHIDDDCSCTRCEECALNLDAENVEPVEVTVPNVVTGSPVILRVCDSCAEKLEKK